jgi:two-component system chemotaxis response regulator CheB
MNGITTVKNIMVRHQIPIVIISSLVQDGYFAFEALRLGVMDFLPKPSRVQAGSWDSEQDLIRTRVRAASGMHVHRMRRVRVKKRLNGAQADFREGMPPVVVMGTTLAGPNTIMRTVTRLARDFPGAIIALQEIHPRILAPFCAHFNTISPLEVVPVNGPCSILPGRVYIGSTSTGLRVDQCSNGSSTPVLNCVESPPAPIDELFATAARQFGPGTCGVLLTGIGTDGANGMREIQRQGGLTIAEEQHCCVYPNLVEHAIREDVVDAVMSGSCIAERLKTWAEGFFTR